MQPHLFCFQDLDGDGYRDLVFLKPWVYGTSDKPEMAFQGDGAGLMLFRNQGIVRDAPQFTAISWNGFGNPFQNIQIPSNSLSLTEYASSRIMFEDADGDGDLDAYTLKQESEWGFKRASDPNPNRKLYDFRNAGNAAKADFSGGAIGPTGPHCEQSSTCVASIFGKSSTANSVDNTFKNDLDGDGRGNPFSHDFDFDGDDDVFWLYADPNYHPEAPYFKTEKIGDINEVSIRYRKRESGLPATCPVTTSNSGGTTNSDGSACSDGSQKVAQLYIDYNLSDKQRNTTGGMENTDETPSMTIKPHNPFQAPSSSRCTCSTT